MAIIRAILNNGFFIIVLVVAATLYLTYSDNIKRDHGLLDAQNNETEATQEVVIVKDKEDAKAPITKEAMEETEVASVVKATEKATPSPVATVTEEVKLAPVVKEIEEAKTITPDSATEDANAPVQAKAVKEAIVTQTTPKETAIDTNEVSKVVAEKAPTTDNKQELSQNLPKFSSISEAKVAAQQAMRERDFETASKIYFDLANKAPSANASGELARALYLGGKKDWAADAWMTSAKQLFKENRYSEAAMLADRLVPYAPNVSKTIYANLQNQQKARPSQSTQNRTSKMQPAPSMPKYPAPQMQPAPNMPSMPVMPAMPSMPTYPAPHMQPAPNMPSMPVMPAMPSMPTYPAPHMQPAPNMPSKPVMPAMPSMPTYPAPHMQPAPNMPSMPVMPAMPSMPTYPAPHMQPAPNMPSMPVMPAMPSMPTYPAPYMQPAPSMPTYPAPQMQPQIKPNTAPASQAPSEGQKLSFWSPLNSAVTPVRAVLQP